MQKYVSEVSVVVALFYPAKWFLVIIRMRMKVFDILWSQVFGSMDAVTCVLRVSASFNNFSKINSEDMSD